jgi:uracil phosphoribosyltransferase
MFATGGTMLVLLESLIDEYKFKGKVHIISTIAAKIGADVIGKKYPKVKITCAGLDTEKNNGVNDVGYIYPGLGDASDRFFGIQTDLESIS